MAENDEENRPLVPFIPSPQVLCTDRLFWFLTRQREIYDFFLFGVSLATRADEMRLRAAKALAEGGGAKDTERLKRVEENRNANLKTLQRFARLQTENICIRSVDNFVSYLAEAVQMVMLKNPQVLKSGEQIKLDEILQFRNYSDLVSFLIDRKVTRLTFSGVGGLGEFISEKLGVDLTANEKDKRLLTIAVELRNIYTHTRGLVSEVTFKRLEAIEHGLRIKRGEAYLSDYDELVELTNNLVSIALRLDDELASH